MLIEAEQTASIFSGLHALGGRQSRSDRKVAKWDKIIKLEDILLSLSAKWIKGCLHVAASPPKILKHWQDYKL